ncbi:MAG: galactose mutarotase [Clostridia bacterium]|nr:galactose mutarotase [Clostridia bacterium]
MSVTKTLYGTMPDGREVHLFTIENNNGLQAGIITYGATLAFLNCPDKNGVNGDVIMGFDTLEGHLACDCYCGRTVGQYCNRIANGKFTLGKEEISVDKNENGVTCLHGGGAYSSDVWKAIIADDDAVEFSRFSPDGEAGFPGNVNVTVTYSLNDHNELEIDYKAVSDSLTVINMTNHAYFNLAGADSGDILSHILKLNCSAFTPTDDKSIPTGEIKSVSGTAFDFTEEKPIGRDIALDDVQLTQCRGYDHNFCIDGWDGKLRTFATVYEPVSGRTLEAMTDLPGVQLYCGNFLDGTFTGKNGKKIEKHNGFCLETQFYPDTPNQPSFPKCVYKAGSAYESTTIYKFGVKKD